MAKATFFKFRGLDKIQYAITLKEKLFSEAYLSLKGHGVDAIYEAGYNPKDVRVAAAMASEYLTKPNISAYIILKLEEFGFNDDNVEKQHLFLLNQFADLQAKKGAIDMFYKVRGKYAPKEIKLLDQYENFSDEQIEQEIAKQRKHKRVREKSNTKKATKST